MLENCMVNVNRDNYPLRPTYKLAELLNKLVKPHIKKVGNYCV